MLGGRRTVSDHEVSEVSPLVEIDPEDREQVKRLDDLLTRFVEGDEVPAYAGTEGATRAALREFARPALSRCGAVLNIAGEHFRCDGARGHDDPHTNEAAQAIWGEVAS